MLLMQLVDLYWLIGPDLVGHGPAAAAPARFTGSTSRPSPASAACGCTSSRGRPARAPSCRSESPRCARCSPRRRGRRRTEAMSADIKKTPHHGEPKHQDSPTHASAGYEKLDAHAGATYRAGLYILGTMFLVAARPRARVPLPRAAGVARPAAVGLRRPRRRQAARGRLPAARHVRARGPRRVPHEGGRAPHRAGAGSRRTTASRACRSPRR